VKSGECRGGGDPKNRAHRQAKAPEVVSGAKGHAVKTHPVENRLGKMRL